MNRATKALVLAFVSLFVIWGVAYLIGDSTDSSEEKYYEIISYFDKQQVVEYDVSIGTGTLTYYLKDNPDEKHKYALPDVGLFVEDIHDSVLQYNREHPNAPIKADYERGDAGTWVKELLPLLLVFGLTIAAGYLLMRRMGQTMGTDRTMSFGKARVKQVSDEKRRTTFEDVAGADEEKEELKEIVEFLKNPQKFNDLGARIPKGVLLVGPPGTGKTLLARAVAGEAGVPFFSISGSDFVEMYVGVGASRVRDLFIQAKKSSPSIIFIDEIDAVGRHRGAGLGGGHDEREQTLNQLLVEMDGFGANEGVIIIAATNRPDILDPALLRPGRFDRQVTVSYPDVKGRKAILEVHARNKSIGPDVDLDAIAHSTSGFTGADLENLLNEAALLAARKDKRAITMAEVEEATVKVMMGTEKKNKVISDEDKRITSYHEAGHAVVSYFLPTQDPVHQISIIPRGLAGGYTMYRPIEDKQYVTLRSIEESICSLLGGRAAESLTQKDICTGASNDIQRATELARNMITKYGMSRLGPRAFGASDNGEVFLGKDYGHQRDYSENIAAQIDEEIERIINEQYERSRQILQDNMEKLKAVAEYLFEHEKLDGDKFRGMMGADNTAEPENADESNPEPRF